jgi:hypothetical protein
MLKAHEVTTVCPVSKSDYSVLSVKRYIVIAKSTSKAVSLVPIKAGEEILEAHEMQKYTVILEEE